MKRLAKESKQKANFIRLVLVYNPIGRVECENLQALAASKGQPSIRSVPDLRMSRVQCWHLDCGATSVD